MAEAKHTCPTCATPFARTHSRQRYCSPGCRLPQHRKYPTPCTRCGTVAMKYPSNRYKQFCGTKCRDLHLRDETIARAEARPAPVPYDPRSALRRAIEDGTGRDVIEAIRQRTALTAEGCWSWQGRLRDGYPEVTLGVRYSVHRLSLEAKLGNELGDQPAHHICANASCVNPDHLQPVTHRENTAEMLARTYMERRILALESALRDLAPGHALLREVSIPRAVA